MGKNKKKNNVALPWDESGGAGGEDSPPAGGQSTADSKAEDEAPLDKKSEAKGTGSSFDWMASNDDTAWGSKSKGSKKKDYLGAFDDPGSKKKDNSGTFDGVGGKKKDGFGAFGDLGGGTTNDYMSSFNIGTAVTEDTSGYDWFDSGDKGLTDHIGSVKKDDEFKPATTSTNAQAKKKKNKFSTEAPATEATNYEATTSNWDTNLDDKEDFKSTATNSASKDKKNKKNATETLSEDVSAFTTSGSFWETKEDAMNEPSKSSFSWDAFDSKPADDPPEDSSSPWAATATKKKKSKKGDEKSDAAKEDTKVSESTAAPEEDWMSWDADKGDKKGKKGKSIFGSSANAAADENIPPVPPIPAAEEATKNSFFDVDTEDNWGNNWGATAAKKGKVGKESNGDSGKTSAGIGKKAAVLEKSDAMSDKPKAQAGKAAPDPSFGTTSGLDEGKDTKVAEAAAKKAKKKGKKGDVAETKEDDFGDRSKSKDNSADLGDWGSFAEVSKSKGATGKSATGSGKKTVESEKANADVSSSGVLRPDGVDEPKQAEAVGKKGKRKGGKKADPVEVNDDLFGDTADFKQQPTAIDEPDFGADDPPTEGWGWNAKKKDKKDGKTKINGLSVTEEKPTAEPKPDLWDVSAGGDDQYDDDFLSSQPAASAKKGKAAKDGTTPAIVSASTTVKGTTKAGKEKKVREPETLESPKEDDAWAFWGGAKKNDKGKDDQAQKIEAKGKPDGKTTAKSSSIQPPSTDKEIKKPIVPSTGNSIADRIKKLEEKKGGKRSSEAPFESMLPQSIPATESFAAEPDVKPSKVTSKKKEQTDKAKGDKISKDSSIIPGGFPSILEDGVGTGKDKKTTKKNAKSNPEDIKAATSKDKSPAQESAFVTTAPDKGEKADKTDKGKSKGKTKADSSLFDDFMDTPTKENPKIGEDPMISSGQEKGEKSKSKNKSKTDGISVDGRAETLSKDKSRSVEPKTSPSIAENPDKSKTKGKPKADVSPTAERVSAPSVDKGKGVEPKSSSTVQDKGDKTKSKSKTKAEPVATDAPQEDSSRPKTTVPSTSWGFWGTSAAEEAVTPEPEEKPDKKKKKPTGPEPTKPTESTKTKSAKPVTDKPKASHDALASPPPPSPAQAADSIKRSKTTSSRSTEKQTISKIKEQPASKNIPAEEEPPTVRPANPKRSSFMGFFASPASTGGKDEAAEAPDIPVIDKGRSIKSMEPEMSAKAAKVLGIRSKADRASVKPTKKSGVKDPLSDEPQPVSATPKPKRTPSKSQSHSASKLPKQTSTSGDTVPLFDHSSPPVTGLSSNKKSAGMGFFGNLMGVSRPSGMSRRNSEAGVRTRGNSLMSEEEEAKQARREARRKKREAAAAEQSRAPSKVVDEEDDAARRARRAERKARKEAELRAAEPKARSRKIDVNEQDYQVLEEERAKKEEKRRKREAVDRALDERQRRKEKHRSPEPERSSRRRPEAEIRHTHATYEDPEEDRRARRERRASRDVSNARPKQERRRTAPANDFMDADVTKDPDAFRHLKGQDIPREVGGKKHMSKWINSLEREPPEPPPIEGTVLDESGQKPRKVHEFEDEEIREKERRRERRKSTREPVQAESGKDRSRHRRPKSSYVHGYGDEDGLHRDGSSGSPNGIDEPDFGGGGGGRTRRTVGRRDSYVDAGVVDEAEDAYRTAENGVPESKLGKSSWWKGARAKMGIN